MKRINLILSACILSIGGIGVGILLGEGEPAKWEFSNANQGAERVVVEFTRQDAVPVTTPTTTPTEPTPAPDGPLIHYLVRLCTSNGEPLRGALVEAFQYRGTFETKVDSDSTDSEGAVLLSVQEGANGRLQITQQFSTPVVFRKTATTTTMGPCPVVPPG